MSLNSDTIKLQESLSNKAITKYFIKNITKIGGTDVSYKKGIAQSSATVVQNITLELLEHRVLQSPIDVSYISGLLMLRESGPCAFCTKITRK